jgi:VWFA-related protein
MIRTPLLVALMLLAAAQQRQTFRVDTDMIAVDVAVIDPKGAPVPGLNPEDFDVTISGRAHKVIRAAWLAYGAAPGAEDSPSATAAADAAMDSSNRMFVIAIDEESFQPTGAFAARAAVEGFIDKLRRDDRVGLIAFPADLAHFALTTDHASVKRQLFNVAGVRQEPTSRFHMSVPEIIDIANGDGDAQTRVFDRECSGGTGCTFASIRPDAESLATYMEMEQSKTVEGVRGVMRGLAEVPGRKVLVLVSGGMISSDRHGGRVNASTQIQTLASQAAAANAALFVLHLDWSYQQTFGKKDDLSGTYFRNAEIAKTGLELMAGMLGGDLIRVQGNSGDVAFARVLNETSAYYLLGVEAAPEDRDGKAHPIKVKVKKRGLTVLARSEVTIPLR